jgi:sugar transferase (PEP-CTERM/EpsH1 system associated)
VSSRVAASLFVSEAEAQLYRDGGGQGAVRTVENGIDARIFDPAIVTPVDQAGPLIVFTGQMDYRPNIDAVVWFASEVLPRIRQSHPQARFAVVGRAPSAAVTALAGPNVIVTGAVDDVRGWLAAADVCVAPLHLARGIQNKVLEAMAMARPVVASPAAAEGIDHDGALRVANGAEAMAEAVVALLEDRDQASALGLAARRRVIDRYDWDARLASLGALTGLAG